MALCKGQSLFNITTKFKLLGLGSIDHTLSTHALTKPVQRRRTAG